MTLTLELTPDLEERLDIQARAAGIDPAEMVLRLIAEAPVPEAAVADYEDWTPSAQT